MSWNDRSSPRPLSPQATGFCECGCGQKTVLATQTRSCDGIVKGQPVRFVHGHSRPGFFHRGCLDLRGYIRDRVQIDENGCWIWQLGLSGAGYGSLRFYGKGDFAHRVSYLAFKGVIPEGLQLDHLCRTPACVNPDHLEAVTPRENYLRGVSIMAENARKTHCKRGHPFDDANTRVHPTTGHRQCRACDAFSHRERRRELREAA